MFQPMLENLPLAKEYHLDLEDRIAWALSEAIRQLLQKDHRLA